MRHFFTIISTILLPLSLAAQDIDRAGKNLSGQVLDSEDRQPLAGATVKLQNGAIWTVTDGEGNYHITSPADTGTLVISYIGYTNQTIPFNASAKSPLNIYLKRNGNQLQQVVVSTGYQTMPKERATGSFVQIDNELLNRRVSPHILDRLEDVTPGLIFNKNTGNANDISIRGRSTIFAEEQPLIVIDNFPYEGDINTINPNDVESITVLKDAAAASIWGARAGNGVIVITTKNGQFNEASKVSFNSNVTVGQRPDVFYTPQLSSASFIDAEQLFFNKGYYDNIGAQELLTPVVQLLKAKQAGDISASEVDAQIAELKALDVRNDYQKYVYREPVNQQYALNLSGGTASQRYYLSAGYDKDLATEVGNQYNRITLNASNTYRMLNKKLELSANIFYTESRQQNNNPGINAFRPSSEKALYPYAQLADEQGQPLSLIHQYTSDFITEAESAGLLDWQYRPLDEINNGNNMNRITDYRVNVALKYRVLKGLDAGVYYQYAKSIADTRNLQSQDTWFTRDLINTFSQVNTTGSLTRQIPLGAILDTRNGQTLAQNLRGQLNFNRLVGQKHSIAAVAGAEIRDNHGTGNTSRLYGYDPELGTSSAMDYVTYFNLYSPNGGFGQIIDPRGITDLTDRFISFYSNASYTYDKRYTVSGSIRKDESNLFGVKTNQRGSPFWSAGLSWNISRESFFKFEWLPELKVRATYGYNGNIDKSVTAFTTAQYFSNGGYTGQPYASIINPPNPDLRWERVGVLNLGADFGLKNNIISGSIEYYSKKGDDLIGNTTLNPSSGVTVFRGNVAGTLTKGVDLVVNSRNLNGVFKWNSNLLFSYAREKVTDYDVEESAQQYITNNPANTGILYPLVGKPLYGVYSYQWAGLDPQTGDPQGYLNGSVSKDYNAIRSGTTIETMIYNGPQRPPYFGALRNTFSWKQLSLSVNISYRFGYYFKRNSVSYTGLFQGWDGNEDFDNRWQEPGDEQFTQVPSLPETLDGSRDAFYLQSEAVVEKGDNIRLQDLSLSYTFDRLTSGSLPIHNLQLYVYANNLGLLWKANKAGLDPDYLTLPLPKTFSFGIKADFR